jgi:hypothetical protein
VVFARLRRATRPGFEFRPVGPRDQQQIARTISALERGAVDAPLGETLRRAVSRSAKRTTQVVGITGTGGAGKSSLTDELLLRFVRQVPERNIAVVAMDPTRRRSGGALLGDRIRMNSLAAEQLFMRSLATRRQNLATSAVLADVLNLLRYADFDLVVVETAGIGQSDSRRRPRRRADVRDDDEYGAASQLEKIVRSISLTWSRSTSSRSAAPRMRCATCASSGAATGSSSSGPTTRCRCSRPSRAASTIRASTASLPRSAHGSTKRRVATGAGSSRIRARSN